VECWFLGKPLIGKQMLTAVTDSRLLEPQQQWPDRVIFWD